MSELGAIRDAVTGYFDRRPTVATRAWDAFTPAEHAFGFTVARSAGFDILDDIKTELRKAIGEGMPFHEFRQALEPTLKAKGWWGTRESVDATGRTVTEQLGSARRLNLIYDANIRSAQAAGEWIDLQANKDFLPFLEYVVSLSERKRPEHCAWVGTTLPVDDPWWRTHFPPNGWRCKCRTRPRSEPRDDLPPAKLRRPPLDPQPWTSRTTGQTRAVPKGIDPGWDNNAGMSRQRMAGQELVSRIERMSSDDARRAAVAGLRQDPAFDYVVRNKAGFDHARRLEPQQAEIGRLRWPVAVLSDAVAARLPRAGASRVITVSAADAAKIVGKHGLDLAALPLQEMLDANEPVVEGSKLMLPRRIDGRPHVIVIKASAVGELFLNSIHVVSDRQWREMIDAAGGS
ncbi:MAG: hypothetical protein HEQ16_05050 [Bosea sp.]|nr:hypothetical protein [Bosea sp. (in: a-proteobacteria)]